MKFDYVFLYWHQNLTSADSQQVLFAMALRPYAEKNRLAWRGAK